MAFQYSVSVRNAKLDQVEATIGTGAILKIFSGAEPANCAAADPAGLLATLTLPSDWMANASAGAKAKAGTWSGSGSAAGTAASFRIYDSGLVACHIQGNVGMGSGDLSLDNTNIAIGQTVTVNTFQITAGNV
jgi:hypothetical protein